MKAKSTQSRERGQGENFPLRSPEAAPLVGFGATPQLFLVKPAQRKKSSKVAAAKRPAPKLRASSDAPPSCSIHHLCCVAPDGRDRTAGLATIAAFSRTQGFRLCGGDQRAMETDEVCDRPLETFGAVAPMFLDFYRKFFILVALLPPDYAEATGAAKKIKGSPS